MGYRDDRDALRAQVDVLEKELGTVEQREQRVEELEACVRRAREDLAELERGLAAARGKPRAAGTRLPAFMGAGLAALVGVSVAIALWPRDAFSPELPEPAAPPTPRWDPPAPRATSAPPTSAPPTSSDPTTEPDPPPTVWHTTARWAATVARAQGVPLSAGRICDVTAELSGDHDRASVDAAKIVCGDLALYDSAAELRGMSNLSYGVVEVAGDKIGRYAYQLIWDDVGPRTGPRHQVSINTDSNAAAAWSDLSPAFRVEFTVSRRSDTVADGLGPPPLRATARVDSTYGTAPVRAGTACALESSMVGHGRCNLLITCGSTVLYGPRSVLNCTSPRDLISWAVDSNTSDADGDAEVNLDMDQRTLVVDDKAAAGRWSATMSISP